jgi:hypothetical protein
MFIQSFLEPARNYRFSGYFYKTQVPNTLSYSFDLADFNKKLFLISNLIKIIRPPTTDIEIDDIDLGTIKYPISKRLIANQFDVVFMEDNSRIVTKMGNFLGEMIAPYGKLNLTLLNQLSFTFIYIQNLSYQADIGTDILTKAINKGDFSGGVSFNINDLKGLIEYPAHIDVYPQVFPVKINHADSDKSGDGFTDITWTFVRIPKLSGI